MNPRPPMTKVWGPPPVAAKAAARRQPWRARARAAARHPTCGEWKSGKKFTRPKKKKKKYEREALSLPRLLFFFRWKTRASVPWPPMTKVWGPRPSPRMRLHGDSRGERARAQRATPHVGKGKVAKNLPGRRKKNNFFPPFLSGTLQNGRQGHRSLGRQ